ncbi:hypothetical protein ABPG74_012289 [Tetrahymena malaccensis]
MHQLTFLLLFTLLKQIFSAWQLVYKEFQDPFEAYNILNWNKQSVRACGPTLSQNGIDIFATNSFGVLGNSAAGQTTNRIVSQFPPHFQMEVDMDIMVLGTAWVGDNINIQLGPDTLFYFQYYASNNINNFCPSAANPAGNAFLQTVYKSHSLQGDLQLVINDYYNPAHDLSVKNIFIYVNTCDYTCATCNGDSNTSCVTCPAGALQSGSSCQCNANLLAYNGVCRTTCPAGNLANPSQRLCIQTPSQLIMYNNFLAQIYQNIIVDWTFTPTLTNFVSNCGAQSLVGGYQIFQVQSMSKTLNNLPSHFNVRLGALIVFIGGYTNYNIVMQIDGSSQTISFSATDTYLGNICGDPSNTNGVYSKYVEFVIPHTASTVTVSFKSNALTNPAQGYWGIREIFVDVKGCFLNCQSCSDTQTCTACNTGYFLLNNQCYSRCPLFTIQSGSTCVEQYLSQFNNGLYILQSLWWQNYGHNDINNWGYTFSGFFSTRRYNFCSGRNIIGGWGVGSSQVAGTPLIIERNFPTLNPHWRLRLIAELFLIDNWNAADNVQIIIDNSPTPLITIQQTPTNAPNNICGTYSQNDGYVVYNQVIPHSIPSLDVQFQYNIAASTLSTTASFGLGEVDVIIDQCPTGCLTCNSATACQSCLPGYYFLQDAQACYADCTNIPPRSNFINQPATPTSVASCVCAPGFYYSQPAIDCKACNYKCTSCNGPNTSDCTVCASNRQQVTIKIQNNKYNLMQIYSFINQTGVCSCPNNYFDVAGNPICQPCAGDCLQCSSQNVCTTCVGNKQIVGGVCVCPPQTYNQGVGIFCPNCAPYCYSCSGPGQNCTSCPPNSNRVAPTPGNTGCPCQTGYYDNGTTICQQCSPQCATCSGSPSNCLTCNATNFFTMVNSQCVCMTGYYLDSNGVCQPCQQYCAVCSGPGPNGCTQCLGTRTGNNCVCGANQYSLPNDVTCYNCNYYCVGCTLQASNCNACDASRLQNPTCSCPNGYYDQNGVAQCQQCQFPCSNCTSQSNCLTCVGAFRTLPTCACQPGYYDTGAANCQQCAPKCATCSTSSVQCLTCAPGRINSNCSCPPGYWDNGQNPECLKCYISCQTCSGGAINQCQTCRAGFIYDPMTSMCNCPTGQYMDLNGNCSACHYSCSACLNGTPQGCVSCSANRNLTSQGTCPCITNYSEISQVCVQTYFPLNVPPYCKVCVVSNICQECNDSFELDVGLCVCPRGTYFSGAYNKCVQCPVQCKTCVSDQECIDCNDGFYYNSQKLMCQQDITISSSYDVEMIIVAVLFGLFFAVAIPYYYNRGINKIQEEYKQLHQNTSRFDQEKLNKGNRRDSSLVLENIN